MAAIEASCTAKRDATAMDPHFADRREARGPRWRTAAVAWLAPAALAAGLALMMWPAGLRVDPAGGPNSVSESGEPVASKNPSASLSALRLTGIDTDRLHVAVRKNVQTALALQQFAGLDHDVKQATRYLVAQVPLRMAWQSDTTDRTVGRIEN